MSELLQTLLIIIAAVWLFFTLAGIVLSVVAVIQKVQLNKEIDDFVKKRRDALNDNNNAD